MMAEQPFDTIDLENGLKIEVWDLSRKLAGDRWLVLLEIRMDIPLLIEHLLGLPDKEKAITILKGKYGDNVTYRHRLEKHFVADNQKEDIFKKFYKTVEVDIFKYLSRPNFAEKFTLLTYKRIKTQNTRLFM